MRKLIMLDSHGPPLEVRCDGCKHWEKSPWRRLDSAGVYTQHCVRVQTMDPPAWLAGADEDDGVTLETMPEFGCALFEPKGPT